MTASEPTGRSHDRGRSPGRPDVVIILADDLGFSDLGCYGSEIATPHLDALAADGVRMSQFYNTARCSPSRASLLTGLHPHATGIGILTADHTEIGYPGTLAADSATMAEVLRSGGYRTAMVGKWHLTGSVHEPGPSWPTRRGFDRFWGTVAGGGSYFAISTLTDGETPVPDESLPDDWYYTDAIAEHAVGMITDHAAEHPDDPLFCYAAFTAPHWPLHAPAETVAGIGDSYTAGWDRLRVERVERLRASGLLADDVVCSDRDPRVPAFDDVAHQDWEASRMAAYAAQVVHLDRAVGKIVDALRATGRLDDALVIMLSDNGSSSEGQPYGVMPDAGPGERPHLRPRTRDGRPVRRGNDPSITPGPADTFASAGTAWSNLSNTPFREHKCWVHEGGIATPLIAHWPAGGLAPGRIETAPHQLTDVMATVLEATGVAHPSARSSDVRPVRGHSMLSGWRGGASVAHDLFFEHEGHAAIRRGDLKLVRRWTLDGPAPWELYDLARDRTELVDLAGEQPDTVAELASAWQDWARGHGVVPRERVLAVINRGRERPYDPEQHASRDQILAR